LTGAVIGAGVTLACHVHRTCLDRTQRNANTAIDEQQREEMEKLMATLSRLAVLAEGFLGLGTHAVEAHQLIAALDQQLSAISMLHHCTTNGQPWNVSEGAGLASGSGAESIEMNKLPATGALSDSHKTPAFDTEGSTTASHTGRGKMLQYSDDGSAEYASDKTHTSSGKVVNSPDSLAQSSLDGISSANKTNHNTIVGPSVVQ
jgi:hypothetical protein